MLERKIKEPVKVRKKTLSNGTVSLYLDLYYNKHREYEFLKLYLIPEKCKTDRDRNKETMALANTIATDIRMISQKLTKMYFIAQYGTWNNLFWKIDCKTWAYMYSGKDTADRLIQQWKHMSFKI